MRIVKIIFIIMILIMLPFALCAGSAQEKEVITWVGQTYLSSGSIGYDAFSRACERVNEQSGGRLVIKPYSGGAIVGATKAFDAVESGALDLALDTSAYWKDKWEVAALFDMQVAGMSALEHFLWFLEGGGVELAREMLDNKFNIHIVEAGFAFPPEIFLSCTKPIDSLEDLKGMKIRTAGDDGWIFEQLGASVTMIAGGEIYEAMARGTIDAFQFMSPSGDATIGLHEVVKYAYLSPVRQPCSLSIVLVNQKQWDKLPVDLQAIVRSSFLEEAWRFFARGAKGDAEAIELYKKSGAIVTAPPKDVEEAISRLAEEMYNQRANKDSFYEKVINSKREWQKMLNSVYEKL